MTTVLREFRALLPPLAFALLRPIPAITFWEDGAGRAYAFTYLFVGCALMVAECFSRPSGFSHEDATTSPKAQRRLVWRAKVGALSLAISCAISVFTAAWFALSGEPDFGVPTLALLSVLPALCGVPYFTLRTQKPFLGVLLAAFFLALIKPFSCIIVRMVYGPNALADGYMTMSLDSPNLLVWLCIAGSLIYSGVFYRFGFRKFQDFSMAHPG